MEQISTAVEGVMNDPRSDVAGNHQLHFSIRHAIAVRPSLEIDLLDCHRLCRSMAPIGAIGKLTDHLPHMLASMKICPKVTFFLIPIYRMGRLKLDPGSGKQLVSDGDD